MSEKQIFETDDIEIDLIDLAKTLLKKWWLISGAAIIGMVAAILITVFTITPMYQSQAMLYVLTNTTSVTSVADLQIGSAITGDFAVIATSKPVIDKAIDSIDRDEGITFTRAEIKGMLTVTNLEDTRILVIEAVSADAEYARMVANAVADATAERMAEITKKDPPTVVERAETSKAPISPSLPKNAVLGFLIGAFLVCAVLVVRYMLNDNIKTEEDVMKYLGEVPLVSIPILKNKGNKVDELKQQRGDKRGKKR